MPMEPATGYWLGNVTSGTYAYNRKKNPQVILRIVLVKEAVDGKWQLLPKPMEETIYMQMSGGAIPITEKGLEQLGFNGNFGDMQFSAGEEIQFESYDNVWEGQVTRKFRLPAEGGAPEPVSDDLIRKENARWRNNHPAKPAGKPAAPPARQPAKAAAPTVREPMPGLDDQEPPPTGDEIPFDDSPAA